jgi:hypothetical protein
MGEKSSATQARRAIAKLTERYFAALKRELADQTEEFWTRVETAVSVKARDEKIGENT